MPKQAKAPAKEDPVVTTPEVVATAPVDQELALKRALDQKVRDVRFQNAMSAKAHLVVEVRSTMDADALVAKLKSGNPNLMVKIVPIK